MPDREEVIKRLEHCIGDNCSGDKWSECDYSGHGCIDALLGDVLALLKAQEPQWTPINFRPLTEEEKSEHPDWCYIIDSPTPDDGDEILVSDGDNVWADVWCNNGEWCSLESDHEMEGVAWMKMPTPWKKEGNA